RNPAGAGRLLGARGLPADCRRALLRAAHVLRGAHGIRRGKRDRRRRGGALLDSTGRRRVRLGTAELPAAHAGLALLPLLRLVLPGQRTFRPGRGIAQPAGLPAHAGGRHRQSPRWRGAVPAWPDSPAAPSVHRGRRPFREGERHSFSETLRELGGIYIAARQYADARNELAIYTERRPYDPEGLYYYGQSL